MIQERRPVIQVRDQLGEERPVIQDRRDQVD